MVFQVLRAERRSGASCSGVSTPPVSKRADMPGAA